MNTLEKELTKLISTNKKSSYFKNQSPTVFHVSEAAKCSQKVVFDREKNKLQKQGETSIEPAFFTIGKAYEKYIHGKLPRYDAKAEFSFDKWTPVQIVYSQGCGYTGSPDIVYREGQMKIPIEIKTTGSSDLEWYASGEKVKIQGSAYALALFSNHWYLLVASKNNKSQRFFKMNTKDKVYKEYTIEEFLRSKFVDLTGDLSLYSPMWTWECQNRSSKCEYREKCPFFKP